MAEKKKQTIRSQWKYRKEDKPAKFARNALGLRRTSRFAASLYYPDLGTIQRRNHIDPNIVEEITPPSYGRWPFAARTLKMKSTDMYYTVQPGDEYRLDLLAYRIYGSTFYWWILALVNEIRNPFTQPKVGDVLRVPAFTDVVSMMASI